jgi:hypothetical protein
MGAGRFVCVALPIILLIGSIISLLIATLAGVTHNSLNLFTVDLTNLDISNLDFNNIAGNLGFDVGNLNLTNLADNVNLEDIAGNLGDISDINVGDIADDLRNGGGDLSELIGNAGDIISGITGRGLEKRQQGLTPGDLGIRPRFQVTLWGYCTLLGSNRTCTDAEFDWANTQLNLTAIEEIGNALSLDIQIPESLMTALRLFRTVIKWAEIAFIVALVVLGIELVVGIFSNFSRAVSCLTWFVASIATVLTLIACGLATATAAVVVGAIEGSNQLLGAQASIGRNFLVAIWIGAALALAAGLFWIFTICCCKPERRSRRDKFRSTDGEKLIGASPSPYVPLGNDFYQNNNTPQQSGVSNPYVMGTVEDYPSNRHSDDITDTQVYGRGTAPVYTPLTDTHEMTSGNYQNRTQPQFDPTYTSTGYSGAPARSPRSHDAYEPYAQRY